MEAFQVLAALVMLTAAIFCLRSAERVAIEAIQKGRGIEVARAIAQVAKVVALALLVVVTGVFAVDPEAVFGLLK